MIDLASRIAFLYPLAIPTHDYIVQDDLDGNGPQLEYWNSDKLGVQPTNEQLLAVSLAIEPGTTPPNLVSAAFNITIENSDVSGIEGAFNLIAARYLDVGQYMLFFLEPQPDAEYVAQIYDGGMTLRVTDKQPDYLLVEAKDNNGAFADPAGFGVAVYRF